jgi:riboflavin biosynthesis pyrimidine reductase
MVFVTSESLKKDVQKLRASMDAILTGGNTVRNDNPIMNARVDFPSKSTKKNIINKAKHILKTLIFLKMNVEVFEMKDLIKNSLILFMNTDICSMLVEAGPKLINLF